MAVDHVAVDHTDKITRMYLTVLYDVYSSHVHWSWRPTLIDPLGPSPPSLSSRPSLVAAATMEITCTVFCEWIRFHRAASVSAVSSITVHADCEGCLSSAAHCPKVPYERTVWLQAASRARSSPISSAGDRGDMLDFLETCLWPSSATCNHTINR